MSNNNFITTHYFSTKLAAVQYSILLLYDMQAMSGKLHAGQKAVAGLLPLMSRDTKEHPLFALNTETLAAVVAFAPGLQQYCQDIMMPMPTQSHRQ